MSWLSSLKIDDALAGFCWLAMTAGLLATSVCWTRRAFPRDRTAQKILHIAVLFVALVLLILTVIGTAGLLNSRLAWIFGTAATCVFAMRLIRRLETEAALDRTATADTSDNMDANRAFSGVNALEIEPEPFGAGFLWLGVLSLLLGHMIYHGVLQFPTDWDTLMYHLPFIDHWLQTGTLATTHSARWSNPANSELLGLWFAGMFSGDFLVSLNNLPVMIVWAAGLLELAWQLGITGWWRHFAAIACMAVHTTVHETDDASNDLIVAAFFISGIAYLLRFQTSGHRSDLVLFGMSLGILAGTKHFALGYAAVLLVTFIGLEALSSKRMALMRRLAEVFGLTVTFGGYWYLRNLALTGNPLYPVGSPKLRDRIIYPDLLETTLLFNTSPEVPELAMDAVWNLCGPLHFLAIVLLPSLIVACVTIPLARDSAGKRARLTPPILLAAFTIASFLVVMVTPMLVEDQPGTLNHLKWGYTPVRYALSFLCLAAMSLAFCCHAVIRQFPQSLGAWSTNVLTRVVTWCFGGAALYQLTQKFWTPFEFDMSTAFLFGVVLVVNVTISLQLARLHRSGLLVTSVVWAILLAIGTGGIAARWHSGFGDHFNRFYATSFFTDHVPQPIVVLDERSYAFFGSRRQSLVTQPRLFYGAEAVKETAQSNCASLIVTREEVHNELARYRPSWEALEKDRAFTLVDEGRQLRIFEYRSEQAKIRMESHQ